MTVTERRCWCYGNALQIDAGTSVCRAIPTGTGLKSWEEKRALL